jgi:hypothetical protein
MVAVGRAFTVTTVAVLVEEHALALVTTTVYEPLALAVYDEDVAPVMLVPFNFH